MIARAQLRALRQSAEARLEADGRGRTARRLQKPSGNQLEDALEQMIDGEHDQWGHISVWDTSQITDMSKLFSPSTCDGGRGDYNPANPFNDDISGWDTSRVTHMHQMFGCASSFNQPIGGWDTSKVVAMQNMFQGVAGRGADSRGRRRSPRGVTVR